MTMKQKKFHKEGRSKGAKYEGHRELARKQGEENLHERYKIEAGCLAENGEEMRKIGEAAGQICRLQYNSCC